MNHSVIPTVTIAINLGNAASWISAICAVATMSIALYATFKARDWFSSSTYRLGFEKSDSLLRNINLAVYNLDKIMVDCRQISGTLLTMSHLYGGENENFKRVHSLRTEYYSLMSKMLEHKNSVEMVRNDIRNLSTLKIAINDDDACDILMKDILTLINDWFIIFKPVFLAEHHELSPTIKIKDLKDYDTVVCNYSEEYKPFDLKIDTLKTSLKNINNISFSTLFSVQKQDVRTTATKGVS